MSVEPLRPLVKYLEAMPGAFWFVPNPSVEWQAITQQFPPLSLHQAFHDFMKGRLLDAAVLFGESDLGLEVLRLIRDVHTPTTVVIKPKDTYEANDGLAPVVVAMIKAVQRFKDMTTTATGERYGEIRTCLDPLLVLLKRCMEAKPTRPSGSRQCPEPAHSSLPTDSALAGSSKD